MANFVFWIAIFVGIFYAGFPILATLSLFALAVQSISVVFRLKSNPEWYYALCAAHSIEPNIKSAITTKIVMAVIYVAIGAWVAFQAESKGLFDVHGISGSTGGSAVTILNVVGFLAGLFFFFLGYMFGPLQWQMARKVLRGIDDALGPTNVDPTELENMRR